MIMPPVFLASSMNISQHLGIIFNFIRNLISIGPKVMKESGWSSILFHGLWPLLELCRGCYLMVWSIPTQDGFFGDGGQLFVK